jgi:hypothetical protein
MTEKILLSVPWYVSGTHNYLDKSGKLKSMGLGVEKVTEYVEGMIVSLVNDLKQSNCHVLIVEDGSPFEVSEDWLMKLQSIFPELGITILRLERNVGFGHIVNIIQSISVAGRFEYLIRWDTDVWPESSFKGVLDGMTPSSFLVTFKNPATWYLFCLSSEEVRKGNHPRFIPVRSMIGNILVYDVNKFKHIGFDDPLLRGYSDVELQYRSDWAGFDTHMDTGNVVKSVPSGANAIGSLFAQEAQLKYLTGVCPIMSYSKSNNRLVLRGKRKLGSFHRFVPPSPIAIHSCMLLDLRVDALPFSKIKGLIK